MIIEFKHRFTGAVLYSTDVADGRATCTALQRALAGGADLRGAYLRDADLGGADLRGADLRDADLGDADLRGADLRGANLGDANLGDANLRGADLGDADLRGADLGGANLGDADLRGADLGGANLGDANLGDANLGGAYLRGANLRGADLRGADLGGAYLATTKGSPAGVAAVDPPTLYVRRVGPNGRVERARRYREANPDVPVVAQLDAKILDRITSSAHCFDMGVVHSECGTTHCRAGHAVDLAGTAGYALEKKVGWQAAGRAIYLASTGRSPWFFAPNDRAIEDIRRCAADAPGNPPATPETLTDAQVREFYDSLDAEIEGEGELQLHCMTALMPSDAMSVQAFPMAKAVARKRVAAAINSRRHASKDAAADALVDEINEPAGAL